MARTGRPGAVPSSPGRGGHDGGAAPELSTEVVHDRLRRAILRGEFDPKVPLSQVKLAARLGVSRTPLREALRMLEREGLIDSEPNRRVRVAALSPTDLEELYATRIVLEALAIKLTVPTLEEEDLAALEACLERGEVLLLEHHDLLRAGAG